MGRIIGHLCSARILTFSLRIVVRCPDMRQVIDVSRSTKKRRKGTGTSQGNNNEPIQFVTDSQKRKWVEEPSRVNVIEVSLKVDRVERVVKRIVSTHLLEPNR